ncbi:hypothetical protein CLV58_12843 [Spirosoma oryzae]|uniref:DUF7674 domain-containing protein n=1 Tax=Spirosoma oryzae TaxID=1469603 RepID=A0A2T0S5D7_9BACT|nr:hypothetical protein [Spirosoma oryzae]PRY28626.1 hypothetical protein CLV58_12843 [Spirosoma oryzae]
MDTTIDQTNLRQVLADQIPEAGNTFNALPGGTSVFATLHKLYEVTSVLAHQNRFRAVKHCLLAAEDILLHAEPRISNALCTVYIVQLSRLLDKRDSRSDVIRYMLPRAIKTEYCRQLTTCLP